MKFLICARNSEFVIEHAVNAGDILRFAGDRTVDAGDISGLRAIAQSMRAIARKRVFDRERNWDWDCGV